MITSRMFQEANAMARQKGNDQGSAAVFLIDFDGTIASGHVHNTLVAAHDAGSVTKELESQWQYLKQLMEQEGQHHPLGSAQEWKNIFETLLKDGHKVAVISFSLFPLVIHRYLSEVIGLSEEQSAQVYIYTRLPSNPKTANKNHHIQHALRHFEFHGDMANVVVVDDSSRNIHGANDLGCTTIMANTGHSHLAEILALSEKLKSVRNNVGNPGIG